jgi:hypothetical protein
VTWDNSKGESYKNQRRIIKHKVWGRIGRVISTWNRKP